MTDLGRGYTLSEPRVLFPNVEHGYYFAPTDERWSTGTGSLNRARQGEPHIVVARDINTSKKEFIGCKEYLRSCFRQLPCLILRSLEEKSNCMYEHIDEGQSSLTYFDIDADRVLNARLLRENDVALSASIKEYLQSRLRGLLGDEIVFHHVVLRSSDDFKFSEHHFIHMFDRDRNPIRWQNNYEAFKNWVLSQVDEQQPPEFNIKAKRKDGTIADVRLIDKNPLGTSQLFRLLHQCKRGSNRPFLLTDSTTGETLSAAESTAPIWNAAAQGFESEDPRFWETLVTYVPVGQAVRIIEFVGPIHKQLSLNPLRVCIPGSRELGTQFTDAAIQTAASRQLPLCKWIPFLEPLSVWLAAVAEAPVQFKERDMPFPPHPHNQIGLRCDFCFSASSSTCPVVGSHNRNHSLWFVNVAQGVAWQECYDRDCHAEHLLRRVDGRSLAAAKIIPPAVMAKVPVGWLVPLPLGPRLQANARAAYEFIRQQNMRYSIQMVAVGCEPSVEEYELKIAPMATYIAPRDGRPHAAVIGIVGNPPCPILGLPHHALDSLSLICGPKRVRIQCSEQGCVDHLKQLREDGKISHEMFSADSAPLYRELQEPMSQPERMMAVAESERLLEQRLAVLASTSTPSSADSAASVCVFPMFTDSASTPPASTSAKRRRSDDDDDGPLDHKRARRE